jgi:hypothetical protein
VTETPSAEAQAAAREVAERAMPCLRQTFGPATRVASASLVRTGGRNLVVRCSLEPSGQSVIVKALLPEHDLGLVDWTCLDFLGTLPSASGIAPNILAGDPAQRLFIMEDLGPGPTFDDLLRDGPSDTVKRTATHIGDTTARLHIATLGHETAFEALTAGPHFHHRSTEADRWLAATTRTLDWLKALDQPPPTGFQSMVQQIAGTYRTPGPWLALTNGDPAPTNVFTGPDHDQHQHQAQRPNQPTRQSHDPMQPSPTIRLLDFEYGAYRHALYDVTAWWALCPLAQDVEHPLCDAYRRTLATGIPEARDPTTFHTAWATLVTYRCLALLSWIPLSAMQHNHPRVGTWTTHECLIVTAERLHAAAQGVPGLEPAAEAGAALARAFRTRWPQYGEGRPIWGYESGYAT